MTNTKEGKKLPASKSIGLERGYFLLHKSDQNRKLVKAINAEMDKLHQDGYLAKLTREYLFENTFKLPGASKQFGVENNK